MKVDTSRVVVVVANIVHINPWVVPDAGVVGMVKITTGTWVEVGRNTVWYTRVVVAVVVEQWKEIHTQRMRVMVMVVSWDTADAVVRG